MKSSDTMQSWRNAGSIAQADTTANFWRAAWLASALTVRGSYRSLVDASALPIEAGAEDAEDADAAGASFGAIARSAASNTAVTFAYSCDSSFASCADAIANSVHVSQNLNLSRCAIEPNSRAGATPAFKCCVAACVMAIRRVLSVALRRYSRAAASEGSSRSGRFVVRTPRSDGHTYQIQWLRFWPAARA